MDAIYSQISKILSNYIIPAIAGAALAQITQYIKPWALEFRKRIEKILSIMAIGQDMISSGKKSATHPILVERIARESIASKNLWEIKNESLTRLENLANEVIAELKE